MLKALCPTLLALHPMLMKQILSKQTVFYLVLAIAVSVLVSLIFFTWRDSRSLNQMDVGREKTMRPNKAATEEHVSVASHDKPLRPSHPQTSARIHDIKGTVERTSLRRNNPPRVRGQDTQMQVDTQKVMANLAKYKGIFEKAEDLEINDEDIIQTGE